MVLKKPGYRTTVLGVLLLVLSAFLGWRVRQLEDDTAFSTLREQVAQDVATLKILDEEK